MPFSYTFLARTGYFLLDLSFLTDRCEVLRSSRETGSASTACPGLLDGFSRAHRAGRCSRYAIPPAVGHEYVFVLISLYNVCVTFTVHFGVLINQSAGQIQPVPVPFLRSRNLGTLWTQHRLDHWVHLCANFLFYNIDFIIFTVCSRSCFIDIYSTPLCAKAVEYFVASIDIYLLVAPPPSAYFTQMVFRCCNCFLLLILDCVYNMLLKTIALTLCLGRVSIQPFQHEYKSHVLELQQHNILSLDLFCKDLSRKIETSQFLRGCESVFERFLKNSWLGLQAFWAISEYFSTILGILYCQWWPVSA